MGRPCDIFLPRGAIRGLKWDARLSISTISVHSYNEKRHFFRSAFGDKGVAETIDHHERQLAPGGHPNFPPAPSGVSPEMINILMGNFARRLNPAPRNHGINAPNAHPPVSTRPPSVQPEASSSFDFSDPYVFDDQPYIPRPRPPVMSNNVYPTHTGSSTVSPKGQTS
ncbi:hypothetical protein FB45DRAFT_247 [Roridomyces roridus]|uniref:Uncharacterized protein n=1 Tax=Roridomyces roridus TaxID=1738132 RepID=A0AAD7CHY4_9AGAR|nr:hypothetical protein FB45DRAFT_247 [Roridomyces roridus]